MSIRSNRMIFSFVFPVVLGLGFAGGALAQSMGSSTGADSANKNAGKDKTSENTLESASKSAPASKKEEKAYKDFAAVASSDAAKKLASGESFLKDYPNSQYVKFVYPYVVVGYIQAGQMDKALAAGQKDLEANPQDVRTMAVLSQSLARTYNPTTPNMTDQLAKAEDYGKKALAGLTTLTKPEGMTDEHFTQLKTATQSMALSGLGLVYLRQDNFTEAIPDLEKATNLDGTDQTNFYLLAVANMNAQHYPEAAAAFKKCAGLSGNLQATCSGGVKDAQSHSK